jgi:hypothetical protein
VRKRKYNIGDVINNQTVIDYKWEDKDGAYLVRCHCGYERWMRSTTINRNQGGCSMCKTKKIDASRSITAAWGTLNGNAKRRGYLVEITKEEFVEISTKPCFYCGENPKYVKWKHLPEWAAPAKINGIDRRDNSIGYSIDNAVPCCTQCNRAKSNSSEQEFLSWLKRAYKHQFQEVVVA